MEAMGADVASTRKASFSRLMKSVSMIGRNVDPTICSQLPLYGTVPLHGRR